MAQRPRWASKTEERLLGNICIAHISAPAYLSRLSLCYVYDALSGCKALNLLRPSPVSRRTCTLHTYVLSQSHCLRKKK